MGDSLRDHYHEIYKKASTTNRALIRASYASYEGRPGGATLRTGAWSPNAGYRPPTSQRRINLDG